MLLIDYIGHLNSTKKVPLKSLIFERVNDFIKESLGEMAYVGTEKDNYVYLLNFEEPQCIFFQKKNKWYKLLPDHYEVLKGRGGSFNSAKILNAYPDNNELLYYIKFIQDILFAVYTNNISYHLLNFCALYVKERYTFEKPLSSNQMVIDQLVVVSTVIEGNSLYIEKVLNDRHEFSLKKFSEYDLELVFMKLELQKNIDRIVPLLGAYGMTDDSQFSRLYREYLGLCNVLIGDEYIC